MEGAYPSQLLEKAVCEFSKLPGIGRKTALRLVLDLLRRTEEEVDGFATAVTRLRKEVKHCKVCHNISDTDVCPICSDRRRDSTSICVVENIRDVMAVENTQQYNGLYHVLGELSLPCPGRRKHSLCGSRFRVRRIQRICGHFREARHRCESLKCRSPNPEV